MSYVLRRGLGDAGSCIAAALAKYPNGIAPDLATETQIFNTCGAAVAPAPAVPAVVPPAVFAQLSPSSQAAVVAAGSAPAVIASHGPSLDPSLIGPSPAQAFAAATLFGVPLWLLGGGLVALLVFKGK